MFQRMISGGPSMTFLYLGKKSISNLVLLVVWTTNTILVSYMPYISIIDRGHVSMNVQFSLLPIEVVSDENTGDPRDTQIPVSGIQFMQARTLLV